jgi:hypothetical protein
MAQPLRNFRELFQPQHAPYLLQGGFGECALLGAKRCAFGVEPQGAFLFRCELLQSHAHTAQAEPAATNRAIRCESRLDSTASWQESSTGARTEEVPAPLRAAGRRGFSRWQLPKRDRVYRLYLVIPADCPRLEPKLESSPRKSVTGSHTRIGHGRR